ncbi:MAG: hypothetical protein K6L80_10405 [Agarilytica sp.]
MLKTASWVGIDTIGYSGLSRGISNKNHDVLNELIISDTARSVTELAKNKAFAPLSLAAYFQNP